MEKDNTCAICLGNITAGKGQALFTAECSHIFHFNCIETNIQHGIRICPVCCSTWKGLQFQNPGNGLQFQNPGKGLQFQNPGNGLQFQNPGNGLQFQNPGNGLQFQNPGKGLQFQNPGNGLQFQNPGNGLQFQNPGNGLQFQNPGNGLQFQTPSITPLSHIPSTPLTRFHPMPSHPCPEPGQFSDDEPLFQNRDNFRNSTSQVPSSSQELVAIRAFTEFPGVAATDSPHAFSVLVSLRAPTLSEDATRAPIDLVVVLDVSGSMQGIKLTLLKRAVCFVIDNLGPADRLSIVSFSSRARRIFTLRRMSDSGRAGATLAVESLRANGGTNIVEGLIYSVKVLEERRERNPVASIMLFSDGQDNCNRRADNIDRRMPNDLNSNWISHFLSLLPSSICPANDDSTSIGAARIPVHTFGIGSDHDPVCLHAISDVSGGTFSYIQDANIIQDAFARCIGGLLSVVAQKVRLTLTSLSFGVKISTISSGKYSHEISSSGEAGVIDVGDIYAEEQKDFLVQLAVPIYSGEYLNPTMQLLKIECSYEDAITKENVKVENINVNIFRPQILSDADRVVCLEVDRERNRLFVVQSITEAQKMAESGNIEGAQTMLENRRLALLRSSSSQAGDNISKWLEAELQETKNRMYSQRVYQEGGRAYALAGMSAHGMQRTTTKGAAGSNMQDCYQTTHMAAMVGKSRMTLPDDPRPKQGR